MNKKGMEFSRKLIIFILFAVFVGMGILAIVYFVHDKLGF